MNKFIKANNERKRTKRINQKKIKLLNMELDSLLNSFLHENRQLIDDFKEYLDTTDIEWNEHIYEASYWNHRMESSRYTLTVKRGDGLDDAVIQISAECNEDGSIVQSENKKNSNISFETFTEVTYDYYPKSRHVAHDELDQALDRLFSMTES